MRESISSPAAPAALGPYSQAIRAGDFIFCSGQTGLDPATGILREGVAAQAEQVLDNLAAVLAAAGASFADVVKTTIFLTNMADFQTVNGIYGKRFTGALPARSTVQVAALPKNGQVEIEMIAYAPGKV
ncbi:MAG: Rid family detoxifying hydrolase [Chloroflexi bacterium]|nr:Rid family detoxifying hydrolase [Chloroflexota bacterium]